MASIGQTSSGSNSTDGASTAAVDTQATGSTFVVDFVWEGAAFSSISDNKSNTYTQVGTEQAFGPGTAKTRRYHCINGAGGTGHQVTVTTGGGQVYMSVFLTELLGVATASAVDGTPGQAADDASPFTASTTTSNADDVLVAFVATNSGANPTTYAESTGFTVQEAVSDGVSFYTGATATRIVSSAGTYTPSFTQSAGDGDSASVRVTAYKAAGGGDTAALSGTSSVSFASSGSLTGVAALSGASALAFSSAASLTGRASLTGASSLTFALAGDVAGAASLAGSTSLVFAPTGNLVGAAALTGTSGISFDVAGNLDAGTASLAGSTGIAFSLSGDLAGLASLTGAADLAFGLTGNLSLAGAQAGPAGGHYWPTKRKRRRDALEERLEEQHREAAILREQLERALRGEPTPPRPSEPKQPQKKSARKAPQPPVIDLAPLRARLARAERAVERYEAIEQARQTRANELDHQIETRAIQLLDDIEAELEREARRLTVILTRQ